MQHSNEAVIRPLVLRGIDQQFFQWISDEGRQSFQHGCIRRGLGVAQVTERGESEGHRDNGLGTCLECMAVQSLTYNDEQMSMCCYGCRYIVMVTHLL